MELLVKHSGTQPIMVAWFKDDEKVEPEDHCKIITDGDKHVLKIEQSDVDDEAIYRCVASNSAGSAQCKAEVIIEGKLVGPYESCDVLVTIQVQCYCVLANERRGLV